MTPPSEERLAAQAVALQETLPLRTDDPMNPGRRELLDMLGLVGPDGDIIQRTDSQMKIRKAAIGQVNGEMKTKSVGMKPDDLTTPMRDRSTVPAGLRNIPDSGGKK